MERKINISILFFIAVAVLSLAGFFNSYIRFLPNTDTFPVIIHIHFTAFILWFVLIILQPILIKRKDYALHRKLGRLTYFIVPVLVITMLILIKKEVQREMPVSENRATFGAFVGLIDAFSFSAYYLIAMVNKRNLRWHVAFLVAATLVILNPGISRLANHIQSGFGLLLAVLLPFIVAITVISVEKIGTKWLS